MANSAQTIVTPAQVVVTTAGTRQQLSATAILADNVSIQANPANTGLIYVGDNTVSSTHCWILSAGQFLSLEGSRRRDGSDWLDLSTIYVDAATSGDKVQWGYLKR